MCVMATSAVVRQNVSSDFIGIGISETYVNLLSFVIVCTINMGRSFV
jgi:hypothetical protein